MRRQLHLCIVDKVSAPHEQLRMWSDEDMKNCWEASRKWQMFIRHGGTKTPYDKNFEEYLTSLKNKDND